MSTTDLKNMIRSARLEVFTDTLREKPWFFRLHVKANDSASMRSYATEAEAFAAGEECRAYMMKSLELA